MGMFDESISFIKFMITSGGLCVFNDDGILEMVEGPSLKKADVTLPLIEAKGTERTVWLNPTKETNINDKGNGVFYAILRMGIHDRIKRIGSVIGADADGSAKLTGAQSKFFAKFYKTAKPTKDFFDDFKVLMGSNAAESTRFFNVTYLDGRTTSIARSMLFEDTAEDISKLYKVKSKKNISATKDLIKFIFGETLNNYRCSPETPSCPKLDACCRTYSKLWTSLNKVLDLFWEGEYNFNPKFLDKCIENLPEYTKELSHVGQSVDKTVIVAGAGGDKIQKVKTVTTADTLRKMLERPVPSVGGVPINGYGHQPKYIIDTAPVGSGRLTKEQIDANIAMYGSAIPPVGSPNAIPTDPEEEKRRLAAANAIPITNNNGYVTYDVHGNPIPAQPIQYDTYGNPIRRDINGNIIPLDAYGNPLQGAPQHNPYGFNNNNDQYYNNQGGYPNQDNGYGNNQYGSNGKRVSKF